VYKEEAGEAEVKDIVEDEDLDPSKGCPSHNPHGGF